MPNPNVQDWRRQLRQLYLRHRSSDATLGVAIAIIAMLFIAGIITAFIHAADTTDLRNARNRAAPPAAETTGSAETGR